jgi:hypothetical protein
VDARALPREGRDTALLKRDKRKKSSERGGAAGGRSGFLGG